MDVTLTHPINIVLSSAKLIVENKEDGVGTIEFQLFEQPCRLVLTYTEYSYSTTLQIGDRVKIIQNYSNLLIGSEGYVRSINVDYLQDTATIDFYLINPDQTILRTDTKVLNATMFITYTIPLNYIEKIV